MLIRKYKAPNLPEALSKVKEDLGEEAVILKTRFNNKANSGGQEVRFVEVTAAIEDGAKSTPARANQETGKNIEVPPVNKRLNGAPRIEAEISATRDDQWHSPDEDSVTPRDLFKELKNDMSVLRKEISSRRQESVFGQPFGLQLEVVRYLIEKHLPEWLVLEVLKQVPFGDNMTVEEYWDTIHHHLAGLLNNGEPIKIVESGATVVMLVGPAGSGKSSSAARLAFQFKVEQKAPVSLVSIDNFRADSREQLMALANVIGCSFTAISTPAELTELPRSFKRGLAIIDTTGISAERDIDELKSFIAAANPHEIHLVVSADTASGDISGIIDNEKDIRFDRLFVTKLDQSTYRGGVTGAAVKHGLRFSYQSTSRDLPGNISLFDPHKFVAAMRPGAGEKTVLDHNQMLQSETAGNTGDSQQRVRESIKKKISKIR